MANAISAKKLSNMTKKVIIYRRVQDDSTV